MIGLYYDPAVKRLSRSGRTASVICYVLLSLVLLLLFHPDMKDTFFLWRALLLSPEIHAEGGGFWNMQVRQALRATPFIGSYTPHPAIRIHMPIVSAICSQGHWLLLLIFLACGFFWFKAIQGIHSHGFHLQRWFGHAVILVQLFRCVTGFDGILGWRFSITYGIPFLGCDLRDWVLDAVLTGYLLAASIRSSTLFPPKVPVVKARFSHPLRKKQKQ